MIIRILFIPLLLISFMACSSEQKQSEQNVVDSIQKKLISYIKSNYTGYEIEEIHSNTYDKKRFIDNGLGKDLTQDMTSLESKEYRLTETTDMREQDIGILVLHYADEETAGDARVELKSDGFFPDGKVLLRYQLSTCANKNILIYTSSAGDEDLKNIINNISPNCDSGTTNEINVKT